MSDHDRPLNKRGLRDAPRMGAWLSRQNIIPDMIISSTANRAITTARLMAEGLDSLDIKVGAIKTTRQLYLAGLEEFCQVAQHFPADVATGMLVSHNFGLEYLIEHLTNQPTLMPTGSIAVIHLSTLNAWADIDLNTEGELMHVWRPKEIDD